MGLRKNSGPGKRKGGFASRIWSNAYGEGDFYEVREKKKGGGHTRETIKKKKKKKKGRRNLRTEKKGSVSVRWKQALGPEKGTGKVGQSKKCGEGEYEKKLQND